MASAGSSSGAAPNPNPNPLAVNLPSPLFVLRYPMLAGSVQMLCEQHCKPAAKQASFMQLLGSLRRRFRDEGVGGLYQGAHIYVLHQSTRELLRFLADRALGLLQPPSKPGLALKEAAAEVELKEGESAGEARGRGRQGTPSPWFGWRLGAKYIVDAVCYPLLLTWTRSVLLRDNEAASWTSLGAWCREEGPLSLFNGLSASMAHAAFEDAADSALQWFIEHSARGSQISVVDRLLLKQCCAQVASVFTDPFDYVGVIQRCQSNLPGLLPPRPLWNTVLNLPWRSSLFQLLTYSGVLALAFKMVQLKLEFETYDQTDLTAKEE